MTFDEDAFVWTRQLEEEEQQEENKMGFKARQKGNGDYQPIPVGVHRGVASLMVDLGMQGGGKFDPAFKVAIGFQLVDVLNDKGEPREITQTYTNSMNKKANLRKLIETWFGKQFPTEESAENFDLQQLLGRPALVNVVHTERSGKTYANISAVMSLPAGTEKPELKGGTLFYSDTLDQSERSAAFAKLPEWLRKKVDEQLVPDKKVAAAAGVDVEAVTADEDIPF